jgi:2-methylcitrate dehydratase PrpD
VAWETRKLCEFVAGLTAADIPPAIVRKTEELFLDWVGAALAGKDSGPTRALTALAARMGPASGPSQILVTRGGTSPFFAALVNGAASHAVEQDDVHNGSVFHPGTVVFPALVAAAQAEGRSGRDVIRAAIAGYEVGIRIGEFLGRSHYQVFHTTGTAGTLAAAAATAKLLGLDAGVTQHALGTAGTQAAGLWEFLRDGADSKPLHAGKAAADGLLSAYLAREGMTGAARILEGAQGMAAGMSRDADPARLIDRLGTRWAIAETSHKWHACCRHTHPAADAFLRLIGGERLAAEDIARVTAGVHQAAIVVLGPVTNPATVHQAKFSMGTVLGLLAVHGRAGLAEFETHALTDPRVAAFRERVRMELDEEVDRAYPARWIGKVEVQTTSGRRFAARVDVPKGDPGNALSRAELEDKAVRLARFRGAATEPEMRAVIARVWDLENQPLLEELLPR